LSTCAPANKYGQQPKGRWREGGKEEDGRRKETDVGAEEAIKHSRDYALQHHRAVLGLRGEERRGWKRRRGDEEWGGKDRGGRGVVARVVVVMCCCCLLSLSCQNQRTKRGTASPPLRSSSSSDGVKVEKSKVAFPEAFFEPFKDDYELLNRVLVCL
jgi:hypothetical protein